MNPKTRIRSAVMRYFSSAEYQVRLRARARKRREKRGEPPVVHYFHQVDDPYSHLAVQKLDQLKAHYNLTFEPHLVSRPADPYLGSERHFDHWGVRDCVSVADAYGTRFTPRALAGKNAGEMSASIGSSRFELPAAKAVALVNGTLASHLERDDFASAAGQIGQALWAGESIDTAVDLEAGGRALSTGNALRRKLGHYQGAMFHFDGEWFWGIDRIRLLEQRLIDEGFGQRPMCVPEPTPVDTRGLNAGQVLLEYFPSLRSPYTAVGHQRVLDLIERSGVTVEVRPVMPMLMRGVPAPRAKQRYIITDAGREARFRGVPFGRIVDPFGEPVKRAFALLPGARALGKDMAFVTAYLDAAWHDGIDITTEKGLATVAANAGMDWDQLTAESRNADWEALLEANLQDMLGESLWGVPSFRVSGGRLPGSYACWGQDRIWRVENEIAARA